ncbi:MAG: hypothetical protein RRC07_01230 [Anaerolineae bacterium]|nr:hypothetical protein [Anaerolineae bacterium]
MRSLIRELPYEKPLVAGRYLYQRDGVPTGAVESWRLSLARDGYRFLRVDLNAEAGDGKDSTLYHLVLDASGEPERLSFRHFRRGRQLRGNVLFEGPYVTLTRQSGDERHEVTLERPHGTRFWFPATAALGLVAAPGAGPALTLNRADDFNLWPTHLEASEGAPVSLLIMGKAVTARPVTLAWASERRVVWHDEEPWPLQMERDGLLAVESRRLYYGATRSAQP